MEKNKVPHIPDFLISGFMKSGTSSMQANLRQSKEIWIPRNEQNFFTRDKKFAQGPKYYQSKFKIGKINGDKSPSYGTWDWPLKKTIQRIKNYCPNVKFVWMMRDPAERVFSHYCHGKRKGRRKDLVLKDFAEERWVLERGKYFSIIEEYLKEFSKEQMTFLTQDFYISDPKTAVDQVRTFLGATIMNEIKFKPFNINARRSMIVKNQNPKLLTQLQDYYKEDVDKMSLFLDMDLRKLWGY